MNARKWKEKMNKNRSLNTILTLLCLGFVAKILSTLARVLTTRTIGIDAMGLYQCYWLLLCRNLAYRQRWQRWSAGIEIKRKLYLFPV